MPGLIQVRFSKSSAHLKQDLFCRRGISWVLLACVIFANVCLPPVWATGDLVDVDALVRQASVLNLAHHPTWLKLVHYERDVFAKSGVRSAIHKGSFFNADSGRIDPVAELVSTLSAFAKTTRGNDDQHAQCRFPARYLWLKKTLRFSSTAIAPVQCPAFDEWTMGNTVESISFVYATGFLGNPASYYGHILLKFNSSKYKQRSNLLDVSVNYGAIIPENEDPFSYVIKGVFGGYDGGFSHIRYYFHNHNYGELELRNMWEYELNLDQREVDFVIAHAWELLGQRYTYLFFTKNCAYRMAEVLEILDNIDLIPANPVFTLPQAVLQNLVQNSRNGNPLVRSVKFYPSRQSRLYARYESLNASEKHVVQQVSEDIKALSSSEYQNLPISSKQVVLDALLDYYQFTKVSEALSENEAENYYQLVLKERYRLPPGGEVIVPVVRSPDLGRRPTMARVGFVFNRALGSGLSLRARPVYYDALDADSGHVLDSALSMGEVRLFAQDDRLVLQKLDFLKIESVNSMTTGLPGDGGRAWILRIGLEQQNLDCQDCLSMRMEGGVGSTFRLHSKVQAGGLIGGSIQDNRRSSGNFVLWASAFLNIHVNDSAGIRLVAKLPQKIDGSRGNNRQFYMEARHRLGTNSDLRFLYEKNGSEQYSVSLGYYF